MTPGPARAPGYPINLSIEGRPCVVVGGGKVAERKVSGLLTAGAAVRVIAPVITDDLAALAAHERIAHAPKRFTPDDVAGAALVFAATDDPEVNRSVCAAAAVAGIWVNSASDPGTGTFTLMSVVRRADLVVTIGTEGRSPALAKWLRRHVEAEMGPEYETLLDLLSEAREELRASGRPTDDADWQRALESGIVDLVKGGRTAEAKELLRSCL